MTNRRRQNDVDDAALADDSTAAVESWKLFWTEEDEIDAIALRDAKTVSEKVRQAASTRTIA